MATSEHTLRRIEENHRIIAEINIAINSCDKKKQKVLFDEYGQYLCDCISEDLRIAKGIEGFASNYSQDVRRLIQKMADIHKDSARSYEKLYKRWEQYQREGVLPTQFSDLTKLLDSTE